MMRSTSANEKEKNRDIPRHIAIIMDGNGRWAKRRFMPRVLGHKKGLDALRTTVKACLKREIAFLTVFAFSSENWRRSPEEVSFLMDLFAQALDREVSKLHAQHIRLKVVGNMTRLSPVLVSKIEAAQQLTAHNVAMTLTLAVDYGGRWDMIQAVQSMLTEHPDWATNFTEAQLQPYISMAYAPEPELLIRTSGEQRISNFMLWQLAYSELFFTPTLWPDFNQHALDEAIAWYQQRERRFGSISE
jgi:undecaprenyl diphosphate synthase